MAENQNPVFTDESLDGDGTVENPLAVAASGGTITAVESSDDSVVVTNGTGPTVDLSVAPRGNNEGQIVIWDGAKYVLAPNPGGQIWEIVNNGAGGSRLQAVCNSGNELFLLENVAGAKAPILNMGAGAGGSATGGTFVTFQDGSFICKGPNVNFSDGAGGMTLQVFADNAAALLGGLNIGDLYRTGADPDVVCIVH